MKSYERNGEFLLFADGPHVEGKLCLQLWATSIRRETFNMDAHRSQQPADATGADPSKQSGRNIEWEWWRSGFATSTCTATEATSTASPNSKASDTTATANRENT